MSIRSIQFFVLGALILFIGCDGRIVERSSMDYFPFRDGSWWIYSNGIDTVSIEVLDPDTVAGLETMTVSFSGDLKQWIKGDAAIEEYAEIVYYHSGIAYPIIQDFFVRNEIPLVSGYVFGDSIIDSVDVGGITICADLFYTSRVVDFQYQGEYDADIYHVAYQMIKTIASPDTVAADTVNRDEYYAPGIGIVRFVDSTGDFSLIEHHID